MKVYMGMCSWTDPDLVKSKKYYPPSVHKSDDMLKYYASQFPCVEIDSSAYAMPPKKSTTKWAQLVPSNFRFHVKAYNLFTQLSADFATLPVEIKAELQKSRHQSKLPEFGPHDKVEWKKLPRSARDLIWSYFINNTLLPLQKSGKLVAVLFQFPKSFSPHSKGWSLSVDTNFQQRNNLQQQQQQLGDDDDDDEYGIAEKQQPDATVKSEKDKAKSTTTPTPAATATATAAAAAADEQEESSGQFISQAHIIECRDRLASVGINNMTVELRNVRWLNEENRERTIKFLTDNRIGMVCLDEFDVSDEGAPAATTSTTSAAPTTAASSSSSSATPKFAPASTIKTKANSDNKAVTVSNSSVISSSSSSSSDDNDDPTTNPSTNDTMVRGRKREFPLILQDTTQGKFLYTRIHRRAGTHRLLSQTELNQWKRRLERLAEAVSEAGTTTTTAAAAAALASAQTAATSSASKQVSSGSDFAVYMLWNTNHQDHGIINARRMAKLLGPELCPKWQPHSDLLSMFQKQASSKSKVEKQSPTPTDSALPQPHTTTITTTAINRIPDTPSDKKRARAEEEEDEEAKKPEKLGT